MHIYKEGDFGMNYSLFVTDLDEQCGSAMVLTCFINVRY